MSDDISKFLQERIDAGDFPSAVYLVAEKGEIVMHEALGHAVVEPELIAAEVDTIYDLASLTKVLVTGLMSALLIESGEIRLEDPASLHFVGFDTSEKGEITLQNLLSHTSGFRSWLPFYLSKGAIEAVGPREMGLCSREIKDAVLAEIARRPLANPVNSWVTYSDLNFILLGSLVERHFGRELNTLLVTKYFEKLGLFRTFYGGAESLKQEIAASEKGNRFEKQTCVEHGFLSAEAAKLPHPAFREDVIWGEVHDGNAYYMGGVAGHAGLFSTAEEVFKIAQQFLPRYSTMLRPETCELFRTNLTPGMNEHRSFAFQMATTPECAAGELMSRQSFGHLGFTGTSLWIDPVAERVFILLTNRTHNHRLPFVNINSTRRRFHDLAIGQLQVNS